MSIIKSRRRETGVVPQTCVSGFGFCSVKSKKTELETETETETQLGEQVYWAAFAAKNVSNIGRRPLPTKAFSLLRALTRTSQHVAKILRNIVDRYSANIYYFIRFGWNLPTIESQSHLSGKGLKCGCDIVPGEARSEAGVIIKQSRTLSGTWANTLSPHQSPPGRYPVSIY